MDAKIWSTLEFDKILSLLEDKADSPPGKAMARALRPQDSLFFAQLALDATQAALERLLTQGSLSFGSHRDMDPLLQMLRLEGQFSLEDFLHLAAFLENVEQAAAYGALREEKDALSDHFGLLDGLGALSRKIRQCILSPEEVADDASPGLKDCRRQLALTKGRIHGQLQSLLNGAYRSSLQDAVITMRGDRYCLPVKAEYKNQVRGIVHDQSSSGLTFFIEPAAVVELNNQIRELEIREQEEIQRILAQLRDMAADSREQISLNAQQMTLLDFAFAKGKLALEQNAHRPLLNQEGRVDLRGARHPLLPKDKAVPIDLRLGDSYHLLIITGPNTGGKTVSLKTLGLLTLMGQAGLCIPAKEGSSLAFFGQVYADIGDEQSIEQSLSTFSSHMVRIVDILARANEDSLILFDELGAGTDPTEGAALAIAILDQLRQRGIRVMATTHYSELKVYAMATPGIENASCEFDVESLSPTYRLLVGIPGKSNAFAISAKLGLPQEILDRAKAHMGQEQRSLEEVIASLDAQRKAMEAQQAQLEARIRDLALREERFDQKSRKWEQNKDKLSQEASLEAKQILQEAKDMADAWIRQVQQGGRDIRALEKHRSALREEIQKQDEKLSKPQASNLTGQPLDLSSLHKGQRVRILSLGMEGIVESLPDAKGNVALLCGAMRMKAKAIDLAPAGPAEAARDSSRRTRPQSRSGSSLGSQKSAQAAYEINLLGKTVEEALYALDKFLDDALLAHMHSVRIVHGKGTGALRNAVHGHLRKQRYVKEFRLGEFGEGDAGVTIASFR